MPTPKFLAPLKDALKRDKGEDDIEDEEPQLVARDFATENAGTMVLDIELTHH